MSCLLFMLWAHLSSIVSLCWVISMVSGGCGMSPCLYLRCAVPSSASTLHCARSELYEALTFNMLVLQTQGGRSVTLPQHSRRGHFIESLFDTITHCMQFFLLKKGTRACALLLILCIPWFYMNCKYNAF